MVIYRTAFIYMLFQANKPFPPFSNESRPDVGPLSIFLVVFGWASWHLIAKQKLAYKNLFVR